MKKLSTFLILIGIIIILIPVLGNWYTSYQQEMLYQEFLSNQEVVPSIDVLEEAFSENSPVTDVTTPNPISVPEEAEAYKPTILGRIKLPSVSIDLLLVEGTTSKDLNWGAGHITTTPMPGQIGNCAIAGHRNYTFGTYFSQLGEVKIGDLITVEYNDTSYTYEAYEILTVLPTDTSVLAQTDQESILTLITCAPKGSNTHRLIIHARIT
jgi:sortase A